MREDKQPQDFSNANCPDNLDFRSLMYHVLRVTLGDVALRADPMIDIDFQRWKKAARLPGR